MKVGSLLLTLQKRKKIIREYYEQLYSIKWNNLYEMDKFLETLKPPNGFQEEIKNLSKCIIKKEIESVI